MSNLWQHRWLFYNLINREIRNRYVGSVSGMFWALLHPLATLAIYAVVFATIFRVKLPDLGQFDFTTFVALGLWPWLMFADGVLRGTMSVQGNASLVKKIAFPHEILVYAATGASWAIHLFGYVLVLVAISLFIAPLSIVSVPTVILLLAAMLCFSLALALILSALQALFRDVEQFLAPIMMIWFYVTPVLYPASLVPEWMRDIIMMNPVAYIVERCRELLMGTSTLPRVTDLIVLAVCVALLYFARKFFNRISPHFEDFI